MVLPWLVQMVPGAGIEPARPQSRRILSPLRLPVPPPGRGRSNAEAGLCVKQCDRPELARATAASSYVAGQERRPDRVPVKLSESARRVPQSQRTWQREPCEVAIARPQKRH